MRFLINENLCLFQTFLLIWNFYFSGDKNDKYPWKYVWVYAVLRSVCRTKTRGWVSCCLLCLVHYVMSKWIFLWQKEIFFKCMCWLYFSEGTAKPIKPKKVLIFNFTGNILYNPATCIVYIPFSFLPFLSLFFVAILCYENQLDYNDFQNNGKLCNLFYVFKIQSIPFSLSAMLRFPVWI